MGCGTGGKTEFVGVRLTSAELAEIDRKAADAGVSRSAYLRLMASLPTTFFARGGASSAADVAVFSDADIRDARVALSRAGSNINQAARALNRLNRFLSGAVRLSTSEADELLRVVGVASGSVDDASAAYAQAVRALKKVDSGPSVRIPERKGA